MNLSPLSDQTITLSDEKVYANTPGIDAFGWATSPSIRLELSIEKLLNEDTTQEFLEELESRYNSDDSFPIDRISYRQDYGTIFINNGEFRISTRGDGSEFNRVITAFSGNPNTAHETCNANLADTPHSLAIGFGRIAAIAQAFAPAFGKHADLYRQVCFPTLPSAEGRSHFTFLELAYQFRDPGGSFLQQLRFCRIRSINKGKSYDYDRESIAWVGTTFEVKCYNKGLEIDRKDNLECTERDVYRLEFTLKGEKLIKEFGALGRINQIAPEDLWRVYRSLVQNEIIGVFSPNCPPKLPVRGNSLPYEEILRLAKDKGDITLYELQLRVAKKHLTDSTFSRMRERLLQYSGSICLEDFFPETCPASAKLQVFRSKKGTHGRKNQRWPVTSVKRTANSDVVHYSQLEAKALPRGFIPTATGPTKAILERLDTPPYFIPGAQPQAC